MMPEIVICIIDADFAWMMRNSLSGGIDEWEAGAVACVGQKIADSLGAKVDAAIDSQKGRNLRLELTACEAMALACSGQNCETRTLPQKQQAWLEKWFEHWRNSYVADSAECALWVLEQTA